MIRLVLVDDQAAVRQGLRMRLRLEPDITVVGVCVPGQLSPARAQMLQHMGISLSLYAALVIGLNVATSLVWLAIAFVLFWRKSHDWMALLVGLIPVLVGATVPPDQSAPLWQWPLRCMDFLAVVLLFLVFSLFPNGRFVPGWMRYRLWDMDVLVKRTLVYSTLTANLAFIYVSLIIALQFVLRGLLSQTNDVALVASNHCVGASNMVSTGTSTVASTMQLKHWRISVPGSAHVTT